MYILEGNIGAGKSTFLHLASQYLSNIKTILEPVNNWQNTAYGQSLLAKFYDNPHRWAYTFELLTMANRVQDHLKVQKSNEKIPIIERSVYSGYYCFAHNSHTQGFMSDIEWHMYKKWFSFLIPNKCEPPRGFIYLRVAPEVSHIRIKKRNRNAEKTLNVNYLHQIYQRHEQFLINKEGILPHLKRIPVLILNCDEDFEQNSLQLHQHIQSVSSFLHQTGSPITLYQNNETKPLSLGKSTL